MTTVHGHNIVIQQSGAAQEYSNQAHTAKPSPEQAVAQLEANEVVKNSTVQQSDQSDKAKAQKEKQALGEKQQDAKKKKKKKELLKKQALEKESLEMDPDATGKILDTTA